MMRRRVIRSNSLQIMNKLIAKKYVWNPGHRRNKIHIKIEDMYKSFDALSGVFGGDIQNLLSIEN